MSKLLDSLKMHLTGRHDYQYARITDFSVNSAMSPERADRTYEYVLTVSMTARGFATTELEKADLMRSARSQIIEDTFGEFRKSLLEIERALWERNFEVSVKLLGELRKQMFT
jgi:hypothetical protein